MQHYLAFVLTFEGHVIRRLDVDCPDDAAAIERAKGLATDNPVELWKTKSPRRIARFEANDQAEASCPPLGEGRGLSQVASPVATV